MPKQIYCAQCGMELYAIQKALQSQQRVITVIEPHTCPDEEPSIPWKDVNNELILKDKPKPKKLDSLFDSFKFVSKLNDLKPKKPFNEVEDFQDGPGDLRDPDLIRADTKTIAPTGILDQLKNRKP